jgi:hypothetical protein
MTQVEVLQIILDNFSIHTSEEQPQENMQMSESDDENDVPLVPAALDVDFHSVSRKSTLRCPYSGFFMNAGPFRAIEVILDGIVTNTGIGGRNDAHISDSIGALATRALANLRAQLPGHFLVVLSLDGGSELLRVRDLDDEIHFVCPPHLLSNLLENILKTRQIRVSARNEQELDINIHLPYPFTLLHVI